MPENKEKKNMAQSRLIEMWMLPLLPTWETNICQATQNVKIFIDKKNSVI